MGSLQPGTRWQWQDPHTHQWLSSRSPEEPHDTPDPANRGARHRCLPPTALRLQPQITPGSGIPGETMPAPSSLDSSGGGTASVQGFGPAAAAPGSDG